MHDPLQMLNDEHRLIERVLTALEAAAAGDALPPARVHGFYADALDFIAQFADGAHHAKEEELLFPALGRHGFSPEQGPVAVMLAEHNAGRVHVTAMQEQLAVGDLDALRVESLAYAALMRGHIAKEDEILFVMADSILTPEAKAELGAAFACVTVHPPGHDGFVALADRLLHDAGVSTAP